MKSEKKNCIVKFPSNLKGEKNIYVYEVGYHCISHVTTKKKAKRYTEREANLIANRFDSWRRNNYGLEWYDNPIVLKLN